MLILNRAYWMQTILKILILIANYQYKYFSDWLSISIFLNFLFFDIFFILISNKVLIYINISKNANTLMIIIHISSSKHENPEIYFLPKCSSIFPWMSLSLSIFSRVSPSISVINIFKNSLINIIKNYWYIGDWYGSSIYGTPLRGEEGEGAHMEMARNPTLAIWCWYHDIMIYMIMISVGPSPLNVSLQ